MRACDVVDLRGQADVVGRGVSVYLPITKTGRRQAVQVADPGVAHLLAAWASARRRLHGEESRLFPAPATLRAALARSLRAF